MNYGLHFSIIKLVIIGGLAMDKLVMSDDFTVNEFLDQMLDAKEQSGRDVIGEINGLSVSTEGCTTRMQLQNKVASAMSNYIQTPNENPTKRQQDDMTIMLDESIVPKADWNDPNDVLDWMNESTKNLNDPEFARTVYRDGKTPAEVMVEMLKSHGYGEVREDQSEAENEINAKMSDLENYGFLASDLFEGEAVDLSQSQSMKEPPETVMETLTGEVEPVSRGEEDEYRFLSQDAGEFEDGFVPDEDDYEEETQLVPPANAIPDPSMYTASTAESELAEIQRQLEEIERDEPNYQASQSAEEVQRELERIEAENLERVKNDSIQNDELSFAERLDAGLNNAARLGLLDSMRKPLESEAEDSHWTIGRDEKEEELLKAKPKDAETHSMQDEGPSPETPGETGEEFFTTKSKDTENGTIQETVPSFETKAKDDEKEEFLRTKPKENPLGAEQENNEFLQVKPKDEDVAELEAFQAKYGPTANMEEMKIVKRVEQELVDLTEHRKELKDELVEIYEELKNPSKVVVGSTRIANIDNKTNSDLAIHEAQEKIRLSTVATRNNDAVVAFDKAIETHSVMDIIRTANAIETLGSEHLLSASLTQALEEMSKTYYGETVDQLKEDLMEGSRALAEANQLLAMNPDENIYENQIVSVREAIKNITTDRSKEKIMQAVMQVEALEENNPYTPTIMDALDKISNLYYGKSAEEIKNQILDSSKACNEARNEIQLSIKRQRELDGDLGTYKENENSTGTSYNEATAQYLRALQSHAAIDIANAFNSMSTEENRSKFTEDLRNLEDFSMAHYHMTAEELRNKMLGANTNVSKVSEVTIQFTNLDNALQKAVMNHSKENILEAATLAQKLDPKEPSKVAIDKALNQLAVTHLNKNLTELRWQDAKEAIEEAKMSTNPNAQEAMQRFNQATKTYAKADIIVALNMAKEAECPELVSALNKMAIAYYGVDAEVLTSQFKNYSKALSEVQNLISSDKIPKDAKENEAMQLFHQAVQSKSEEDIMKALDAANNLPSYHPMKQAILDALNAQLVLVTREKPMTFDEPTVVVNDNKKELQKKATALLQEYKKVDQDIKKRQSDLDQYAKNKEKEKEKLQEPPAKVINETTNTNPNLFKRACRGAKEALKQMSLKKVAKTVVKAVALGTTAYFAPIPLAVGYVGYKLLRNPEKAKQQKEERKQKRKEQLQSIRDALMLEEEPVPDFEEKPKSEPLAQEEPTKQSAPVEQPIESETQDEIKFYRAEEDEWVRLHGKDELVQEAVNGGIIGVAIGEGPVEEYTNEEIMNYLHNGRLEFLTEAVEEEEYEGEVKRGR